MVEPIKNLRTLLKNYADALMDYANAETDRERDEIADDLIIATGEMEEYGQEVAQLIYELIGSETQPASR